MGFKKNNPGCDCCNVCEPIRTCDPEGDVIGYDVTIAGFVASRVFHFAPGDFTECRRYTFEGYDYYNGIYQFRKDPDNECLLNSPIVGSRNLTTRFALTDIGTDCASSMTKCSGYIEQYTCPMPMEMSVTPGSFGIAVSMVTVNTCSDLFGSNRLDGWNVTISHPNTNWFCEEQTTTLEFGMTGLCPMLDTVGTISLTTTPVFA